MTHQGRRAKIALGSAHVAVREVVARAKAHFGLEGSFGLRTTRGRRAEVPDAAAWAHTGLSNNCELELVRRAGGGGGAVRVAAAVSHMGSAPRTVSFAVDAGTSLAAVVERLVAEGAAPPDPLRRAPTVRVMRDRFAGEDLGRTLGDLGYGGGAAVRLHVELGALAYGAAPPEKRPRDEAPEKKPSASGLPSAEALLDGAADQPPEYLRAREREVDWEAHGRSVKMRESHMGASEALWSAARSSAAAQEDEDALIAKQKLEMSGRASSTGSGRIVHVTKSSLVARPPWSPRCFLAAGDPAAGFPV